MVVDVGWGDEVGSQDEYAKKGKLMREINAGRALR